MKPRCVILCGGPSLANVDAKSLEGATVIALSSVPLTRPGIRLDWWVVDGARLIEKRRPAKDEKCSSFAAVLDSQKVEGISFEDLRKATGFDRCYRTLTAECILLAAHLGFAEVDLYGADWSASPRGPIRFLHESIHVRAAVRATGLKVTRHGAEAFRDIPFLEVELVVSGEFFRELRSLGSPNIHLIGRKVFIMGDAVELTRARAEAGLESGEIIAVERGIMYAVPPGEPDWKSRPTLDDMNKAADTHRQNYIDAAPPEVRERHRRVLANMAERAAQRKPSSSTPPIVNVGYDHAWTKDGAMGETLKGHFAHLLADFDLDKVAAYGGKLWGQSVFLKPDDFQRYQRENPPKKLSGKAGIAQAQPCTNCGKSDPAKPFGSSAMVADELGGV